jgi:hypothetical protein
MKTKDLVTGALLSALSLIIPLAFGQTLSLPIPPFSATLASHVPTMVAFTVNPFVAVMVGLISAFGFLITKGPVVAARALIHAVFGFVGAYLVKKNMSLRKALIITAPIHAIGEALIVLPFGFSLYQGLFIVGVGTLIHHCVDSSVTLFMVKALSSSRQLIRSNARA